MVSAQHAHPRSYSIQTLLVSALQAKITTSLKTSARFQPLVLPHSIPITRTHASIASQTALNALMAAPVTPVQLVMTAPPVKLV